MYIKINKIRKNITEKASLNISIKLKLSFSWKNGNIVNIWKKYLKK